jgi:hypothetical protein
MPAPKSRAFPAPESGNIIDFNLRRFITTNCFERFEEAATVRLTLNASFAADPNPFAEHNDRTNEINLASIIF